MCFPRCCLLHALKKPSLLPLALRLGIVNIVVNIDTTYKYVHPLSPLTYMIVWRVQPTDGAQAFRHPQVRRTASVNNHEAIISGSEF